MLTYLLDKLEKIKKDRALYCSQIEKTQIEKTQIEKTRCSNRLRFHMQKYKKELVFFKWSEAYALWTLP